MFTKDFDYKLPTDLIAQHPPEKRDDSRLMIVDRSANHIKHEHFHKIGDFLAPGDLLVLNNSRVIPARLNGVKMQTGGKVECLLLQRINPGIWKTLVKPGKRLKVGDKFEVNGIECEIINEIDGSTRLISIGDESIIEKFGNVPLPPYIHTPLTDHNRYQTVYAKVDGSAAAPTAGLHFTDEILGQLKNNGVEIATVTLHIGLDTFKPVVVEKPENHRIHTEYFDINQDFSDKINAAKKDKRRIIAVGTTSVRVLEQIALLSKMDNQLQVGPRSGWANIFILPGHTFEFVDSMITNFHMPKSTLLMLVSAFGGNSLIKKAYQEAIDMKYRFYSFGDCMLII